MLTLVTKVLEDGYIQRYYTYTQQGDKISFGTKTAEDLRKLSNTDRNYTIDTNNGIKFHYNVDKERIFRGSAQDYVTLDYNEQNTLFWLLDKLEGSTYINNNKERVKFRYDIGNRLGTILVYNEKIKSAQTLVFEKDTVPKELYTLGQLEDDLIYFRISDLKVTNVNEEVAATVITPGVLYQLYLYTATPLICEDCCIDILKFRNKDMMFTRDQLPELRLDKTKFSEDTSIAERLKILRGSRKPIDRARYLILKELDKCSDIELLCIIDETKRELLNRKKILFKMRYIFRSMTEEYTIVRNMYGKMEIKETT
jgi:hypothetical protein